MPAVAELRDALWGHPTPGALRDTLLGASREVVARAVQDLLGDAVAVERCDVHRAKFKPGHKLSTYYDLRLASGHVHAVAATWLPPDENGASEPSPEEALQEAQAHDAGLTAPFRQLATAVPQHGLRVRVFPLDASFPQLLRMADPGYVRRLLDVPEVTVSPVRYRPGQRHVLRYDAKDAGTFYAKVYNSDKGGPIAVTIAQVADWLDRHDTSMAALRPRAYLAEDRTVLYPNLDGTPLSQLLGDRGPETARHLAHAGAVLAELHHHLPTVDMALRAHPFDQEVRGVTSAASHIDVLLPAIGVRIHALLDRARAIEPTLPEEPAGFAYGDYKADHLWVTPGGLTLMDFDTSYLADQAIDLGKFLADLHWWGDGYGRDDVAEMRRAFLDGYGDAPPERLRRAELYEVLVLVKSTARRVRLFDADWAPRTERLLARAEHLIARFEG